MKTCQVKAVRAVFGAGTVLELSPEQSKPREHNLRALGGDVFEVCNPVEFRVDEVLGVDGDIPLLLLELLDVETPAPVAPEEEEAVEPAPVAPVKKKK